MQTTTRVAVIGGGVVGCSVLYHLTKLGWADVMLLERLEPASGSTWHAAGGFHTLNGDTNMAALQGYTIKLYKELEEIDGEVQGFWTSGGRSHHADKYIAFALAPRNCVTDNLAAEIEILDQCCEAKILLEPLL